MSKSFAETETAVLKIIGDKPQLSSEVRETLAREGFDPGQVCTVIANLWDQGQLNVGLNQQLQIPTTSPTPPNDIAITKRRPSHQSAYKTTKTTLTIKIPSNPGAQYPKPLK